MTPLEFCGLVDSRHLGAALGKPVEKFLADFGVRHLSAAETDGYLQTVTFLEEFQTAAEFDVEVIVADTGRHAYLLDFDDALIAAGLLLTLELFEAVLAVIHYPAYGGSGLRRDLDKIEPLLLGDLERLFGGNYTELRAVFSDEADLFIPYLLIDLMSNVADGKTPPLNL